MAMPSQKGVKMLLTLALGVALLLGPYAGPAAATDQLRTLDLTALSTRPDMVSGGDVLIRVSLPAGVRTEDVRVALNGTDVTGVFRPEAGGRSLVGLVEGLRLGDNHLTAKSRGSAASLKLTNYPIIGPIFSGPHQRPYICETVESGLGAPLDADCSVPTRIDYFYRSSLDGTFKSLPDPAHYPPDLAMTTIMTGWTVPYVVRVESGTINRAIYRIGILDDPAAARPGPWKPGPGWNGKLQYRFGGGCGFGKHQGRNQASAVLDDIALSRGYALATSTLNVYGTACDDVLSAETAMMVKEHFIERYGVPRYTIGQGGSGGAMQQHLVVQNYPGIMDAIVPERSFPDGQTLTHTPTDSALLNHYFTQASIPWTEAQQVAVSGFGVIATLRDRWGPFVSGGTNSIYPRNCTGGVIPPELIYDPVSNPGGVRCTMYDSMVNYYGVDPKTGFARRPLSNVGVQYGVQALNAGVISAEQFLDLNEKIGGFDVDGNFVSRRTETDVKSAEVGYETGRVFNGKGVSLPILDLRHYRDISGGRGDVHTRFHSFETRRRLIDANGTAANQIMWITPFAPISIHDFALGLGLELMDQWLENLLADTLDDDHATKVIRAKPAAMVDGCWDPSGARIDEPATFDPTGRCNTLYPFSANPRIAAGSPIQENVVTCKLKPIDEADYAVPFTSAELARLERIFARGVCDYSKPGFGQNHPSDAWQSFGPAPER